VEGTVCNISWNSKSFDRMMQVSPTSSSSSRDADLTESRIKIIYEQSSDNEGDKKNKIKNTKDRVTTKEELTFIQDSLRRDTDVELRAPKTA
jgi:hypothetical protein